ncbi:MAG TPA: SH3 domain-containing protein [Oscillatoriaceae cyanobacterium M33_DOE_052]|uniref:SH3 domain-containing protein n=1 Tax=Planktothricoides sp. SpSt-374 TaxID=2282167 RepID=A0A7C3ZPB1_9CYAN|nr:SH3 domain-containing protein [Oscillatoriaceae cyanobacterium M33_DOE_052]
MLKVSHRWWTALGSWGAIAMLGWASPVISGVAPRVAVGREGPESLSLPNAFEVAQDMGSLCRRVRTPDGLIVRDRPDPNSPQIGSLAPNTQVTLIKDWRGINGPDGRIWVEINSPVRGFITNGFPTVASNLELCSEPVTQPTPTPTPNANLCRQVDRVAAPDGIAVRADASIRADRVGGVGPGERVTLVPNYQAVRDRNGEDRNWVEITSPVRGFVSASNLIQCQGAAAQAAPQTTPPTNPPTTANNDSLCRIVDPQLAPRGLQIRADASTFSTYRGGIPPEGRVTLKEGYKLIPDKSGEARNWVEITYPTAGFISANELLFCR